GARLVEVLALAEQEGETTLLAGLQRDRCVQGRAGIEAGPEMRGEARPRERERRGRRSVAAEERLAVARRRAQGLARVREGHAAGEIAVVGGAGEDGAARVVLLGDDVQVLAEARGPQHPFVVREDAEAARPAALVAHGEEREP